MNHGARLRLAFFLFAALAAPRVSAAPTPARPALATSLTGTLGYDDNLFLVDTGPLARRESGFATVAARLAWEPVPGLSFSYSPSLSAFFDEPGENHAKHLLASAAKGAAGATSWNASTEFAYVDGDDQGPVYGVSESSFASAVPRERRDQWQNRANLAIRHDTGPVFVRALGKLGSFDMLTHARAGAKNFRDRYDVSGGFDLGGKISPKAPETCLGFRRGYQGQDRDALPAATTDASNHYDRYLLGVDGKIGASLQLKGEAGWSVHDYSAAFPAGPASKRRVDGLYADLSATWTASPTDELVLKTTRSRTCSATSANAVQYSAHEAAWKHTLSPAWSLTLGLKFEAFEYNPGTFDDCQYTGLVGLAWKIDSHLAASANLSHGVGRNQHNAVTGPTSDQRDFDRTQASVGVTWKL
jgi:hypothetical protein